MQLLYSMWQTVAETCMTAPRQLFSSEDAQPFPCRHRPVCGKMPNLLGEIMGESDEAPELRYTTMIELGLRQATHH
jgi:hypothetical protein